MRQFEQADLARAFAGLDAEQLGLDAIRLEQRMVTTGKRRADKFDR